MAGNTSRPYFNASVAASAVNVGSGAQKVHAVVCHNAHATNTVWLQIFDLAAASVTVGTTVPLLSLPLPVGSSDRVLAECVITTKGATNAGLSIAVTATSTGNGAPGAVVQVNLMYS